MRGWLLPLPQHAHTYLYINFLLTYLTLISHMYRICDKTKAITTNKRRLAGIYYGILSTICLFELNRRCLTFGTTVIDVSSGISSALFAIVIWIPDNSPLSREARRTSEDRISGSVQ